VNHLTGEKKILQKYTVNQKPIDQREEILHEGYSEPKENI
jgi:hypothetical protein